VVLEDLSLGEWFTGWTIFFSATVGIVAFALSPNDIRSLGQYLAAAGGVAVVLAALFAPACWGIVQVVK
jgi:hypothetical protein